MPKQWSTSTASQASTMDRRSFLNTSMLATSGARAAAWLANPVRTANAAESQRALPDQGPLPDLGGAFAWLNSAPLSDKSLRGKVVLVNFWTYSCINSLRPLPYVKSWAAKYKDAGLVVIGVHTPEFSFEKERRAFCRRAWHYRPDPAARLRLPEQGRQIGPGTATRRVSRRAFERRFEQLPCVQPVPRLLSLLRPA